MKATLAAWLRLMCFAYAIALPIGSALKAEDRVLHDDYLVTQGDHGRRMDMTVKLLFRLLQYSEI